MAERVQRFQIYELVYTIMNGSVDVKMAIRRLNLDFQWMNRFLAVKRYIGLFFVFPGWLKRLNQ